MRYPSAPCTPVKPKIPLAVPAAIAIMVRPLVTDLEKERERERERERDREREAKKSAVVVSLLYVDQDQEEGREHLQKILLQTFWTEEFLLDLSIALLSRHEHSLPAHFSLSR